MTAISFDPLPIPRAAPIRPLSRREEQEAFARFRAGDERARERIICANLLFVRRVAYEYATHRRPGDLTLEELESEGIIGLLEALDRFDPSRGLKFITYAVWWIRQAILKALGEQGSVVRRPLSPKKQRLADLSLDQPVYAADRTGNHQGRTGIETLDDIPLQDERLEWDLERETVNLLLRVCQDELDQKIIRLYYGLDGAPMTLDQIGQKMGLTRERIRQRRNRALARMRTYAQQQGMIERKEDGKMFYGFIPLDSEMEEDASDWAAADAAGAAAKAAGAAAWAAADAAGAAARDAQIEDVRRLLLEETT